MKTSTKSYSDFFYRALAAVAMITPFFWSSRLAHCLKAWSGATLSCTAAE
jgi:hypothetical protein